MLFDLEAYCKKYKIKPRGIIHLGAYVGNQINLYNKLGVQKVIFIEANPTIYQKCKKNMEKHPHVEVFNFAITNNNEEQIFHITSHQQSSSLLPLKYHANVYPHIHETHTIKVPCRRLDDFLYSLKIDKSDYNFLVMDIQGAELMALEGAIETLKHIDGIALEVNFIELYEGCSLFNDIENFLDNHSFKHIFTAMGKQKSWGDSFFIRK